MTTATWLFGETAASSAAVSANTAVAPFTRNGIITPFARDNKQDFANGVSAAVFESNVRQILGTRCGDGNVPGEIPWMQSFGSLLHKLRHQNFKPIVKYQARAYVIDALSRWEPRVRVLDVNVRHTQRSIIVHTSFVIIEGYGVGRVDEPIFVENEILKAA